MEDNCFFEMACKEKLGKRAIVAFPSLDGKSKDEEGKQAPEDRSFARRLLESVKRD